LTLEYGPTQLAATLKAAPLFAHVALDQVRNRADLYAEAELMKNFIEVPSGRQQPAVE
jgi:hypothetical protein